MKKYFTLISVMLISSFANATEQSEEDLLEQLLQQGGELRFDANGYVTVSSQKNAVTFNKKTAVDGKVVSEENSAYDITYDKPIVIKIGSDKTTK